MLCARVVGACAQTILPLLLHGMHTQQDFLQAEKEMLGSPHQKRANISLLLPLIECVTVGKPFNYFQTPNLFCCDIRGPSSTNFYLLFSEGWWVSIAICFGHSRCKAQLEPYSVWGCQGRRRDAPHPLATAFLCLWRSWESFKDPPRSHGAWL